MTNRTVLIAAGLAAGLLLAGSASAAPLSVPSPGLAGGNANIEHVGRGCPFGLVPSYYGCVSPVRRHRFGYGGYGYRRPHHHHGYGHHGHHHRW